MLSDICMMKTISRLHINPSKNQKSKCQPEIKWKKKSQCVFSNAKIQENKDMQMVGFFSAAMLSTMEDDGISIPIRCPDRLNSFWGWIYLILYLNDLPQKIPFFYVQQKASSLLQVFLLWKTEQVKWIPNKLIDL